MRKVVVLGPSLSAVSGVSTHLQQLFSANLSSDFDLIHFQVGSEGRLETSWQKLLRLCLGPFRLSLVLLRGGVSAVHINTSLEPKSYWRDLGFFVVSALLRKPIVYQVHGGALPADFFSDRSLVWLLKRVLRAANVVVVLARCELDAYREFEPGANTVLIPNAVNCEGIEAPQRSNDRANLKLVYLGRLVREKGVFEIVEAVAGLRRKGVAVELTIAGSGPASGELQVLESQLDSAVGKGVALRGAVFATEKDSLWASSDVFLFPTYHREGLPYALLEGMAFGVPAITTKVGAIPDVVEDGVHGIFVPPRNVAALEEAIRRLCSDRALLREMSDACIDRVRQGYTVERLASQFARVYGLACGTDLADPLVGV